jgi:hypothetical protein
MRFIKSMAIIPAAIVACGIATGCSYHKTVEESTAPAPVVEAVPAPAPVVVAPAPVSSTTTTTTESAPAIVERQKTTTYIPAPY